ncbi:hypothetical protein [Lentzea californiensis]|uniref:hypothetical protein n=1 Tax=Lentzea californiensis TaxID=438851 RepID=UPI002164BF1B|nr:hypothetical protein [Lentzea californiensis]MCR3746379.1 hypothetical protein [Lentzea californiensis]
MIKKTLFATAVFGGAVLAAAIPASAGQHDEPGDHLCAAPWQWNGPLSLLHESHAPGYVACTRVGGGSRVSVLDACDTPWSWNGPLEIFTVDRPPSYAACDGDPAG